MGWVGAIGRAVFWLSGTTTTVRSTECARDGAGPADSVCADRRPPGLLWRLSDGVVRVELPGPIAPRCAAISRPRSVPPVVLASPERGSVDAGQEACGPRGHDSPDRPRLPQAVRTR